MTKIKNIQTKFGVKLKELRKLREISQEELAFRAHLHRTYISDVERGKRNISINNIKKLAKALEIKIVDFFKP